jgi:hypothetical protein
MSRRLGCGQGLQDERVDLSGDGALQTPQDLLAAASLGGSFSGIGASWSAPAAVENPTSERGYYSAPALSPDGADLYLVYNGFTTPFRNDTTSPRGLVGVVLHADIGAGGAPSGWTVLHRGAVGDPRGSSQNNLQAEFLGDYVYAAATRTYGAAVWNDARNAAVCSAINAWRAALQTGSTAPPPAPGVDCPATFGNTDIFGGSYADPTTP